MDEITPYLLTDTLLQFENELRTAMADLRD